MKIFVNNYSYAYTPIYANFRNFIVVSQKHLTIFELKVIFVKQYVTIISIKTAPYLQ